MRIIAGVLLQLLVLGALLGNDANTAIAAEDLKGKAKEAVKEKFLEWVNGWGEKYVAKDETRIAGQEDEKWRFVNVVATESSETIVVDLKGRGDVSTVQQAVDMVEKDNEKRVVIQINPGTYRSDTHPKS